MNKSVFSARAAFPRYLRQPAGSFRFSADALLLAAFALSCPQAAVGAHSTVLDLGTGCGVVGLAIVCREPQARVWGIDIQPELLEAAGENAQLLGFGDAFQALQADCEDSALFRKSHTPGRSAAGGGLPPAGSFDLVVANPPYRQRHKGRLPASPSRLTALFETSNTLKAFCRTAKRALHQEGRFALIYPATRKNDLFTALAASGLMPIRLLPVCPRQGEAPLFILVEASLAPPCGLRRKEASCAVQALHMESPLFLHQAKELGNGFTRQAVDFCPFLQVSDPSTQSGNDR